MPEQNEAAMLLEAGAREIRDLRAANELLSAKVDTFEKCFIFLQSQAAIHRQAMGEDISYKMLRKAAELNGPGPQPGHV